MRVLVDAAFRLRAFFARDSDRTELGQGDTVVGGGERQRGLADQEQTGDQGVEADGERVVGGGSQQVERDAHVVRRQGRCGRDAARGLLCPLSRLPAGVAPLPVTVAQLPVTVAELPVAVAELPLTVAEIDDLCAKLSSAAVYCVQRCSTSSLTPMTL